MIRCRAMRGLVLPAVVLLSACGQDGARGAATTVRDSAGIAIVANDLGGVLPSCAVDSIPGVTIGTLDGEEAYQLHRVFGATRLSDGRIVLVNQGTQQIRYYDSTGRFLRSAGRAGEGPGEFRDAFHLWSLPGDTVWVGDYRPWQFHLFGPDGGFVRTVRPTPFYPNVPGVLAVLDDGRSVLANTDDFSPPSTEFLPRRLTVVLHAPDGALADTVGTWDNGRWGVVELVPNAPRMFPLFEAFARVTAHGSRIIAGHSSTAELRVLRVDVEPVLERIIRWTTGDRSITADHLAIERERLAAPYATMDPALREQLLRPLISESRPVADRFPAFAGVLLGRDGRIWVREYRRPGETAGTTWLGFDTDGRVRCRAAMPEVDQVYEIGADYLLALDPDADGVERVVLHRLAPPREPPVR